MHYQANMVAIWYNTNLVLASVQVEAESGLVDISVGSGLAAPFPPGYSKITNHPPPPPSTSSHTHFRCEYC